MLTLRAEVHFLGSSCTSTCSMSGLSGTAGSGGLGGDVFADFRPGTSMISGVGVQGVVGEVVLGPSMVRVVAMLEWVVIVNRDREPRGMESQMLGGHAYLCVGCSLYRTKGPWWICLEDMFPRRCGAP